MQAGAENPLRGRILIPAVMSEARRGFCRHGTNLLVYWRDRGTNFLVTSNLSWCRKLVRSQLVQRRVKNLVEARNLSRYKSLLAGRCACPGAASWQNPGLRQESAKTVTSLLILPSVLQTVFPLINFFTYCLNITVLKCSFNVVVQQALLNIFFCHF